MSEAILTTLLGEKSSSVAVDYVRNYPRFSCSEAWRWTPVHSLNTGARRQEVASYQFDLPEVVDLPEVSLDLTGLLASHHDAPFLAANLALSDDTLVLRIPAGVCVDDVLVLNIDAVGKKYQFSRVLVQVEKGGKVALWLDMSVEREAVQLPVVVCGVAEDAQCDMVLWFAGRDESQTAQLAYVAVEQEKNTKVRVNAVQAGAALARVDVQTALNGEAGEFAFGGVQMLGGQAVGDCHINVRHLSENCQSHQVLRGVLNEQAQGIFDGLIYVAHGAQQTNAQQDSRYILLSQEAKSHSVPRLEIYADDVQCAHGSTVGFLEPESLFYLQSRGIDKETAKKLLITSFLHESVVLAHEGLKNQLQEAINHAWMGDEDA